MLNATLEFLKIKFDVDDVNAICEERPEIFEFKSIRTLPKLTEDARMQSNRAKTLNMCLISKIRNES